MRRRIWYNVRHHVCVCGCMCFCRCSHPASPVGGQACPCAVEMGRAGVDFVDLYREHRLGCPRFYGEMLGKRPKHAYSLERHMAL